MRAKIVLPDLLMEFDMRIVSAVQPRSESADSSIDRRLRMSVGRVSSCTVIAVRGEVDATNARNLSAFAADNLVGCCQLLVDLSGLDFFGTEGLSALHKINSACVQRGIPWLIVATTQVSRMLQICDPADALPKVGSAAAGVAAMDKRRHLKLL
jgi:anti-anti-sigma factor